MDINLPNKKPALKLDWATHQAAKHACENWHYSKRTPVNKTVKVGVWENGKYVGVVMFSPGASAYSGRRYGLGKQEICELTRVALTKHVSPVSRILAIAIRILKTSNPKLRLVVSYADPRQEHLGVIYQAANWVYSGVTEPGGEYEYFVDGRWMHPRSVKEKFGYKGKALMAKGFKTRKPTDKHRYLMPLDNKMREQVLKLSKPYPKRAGSIANDAPVNHTGEGGANPTPALQSL